MDDDAIGDACDYLADLSNKGIVTLEDLALFVAEWNRTDCVIPDYCNATDFNSNGGLKGFKRDLYEGGVRVPMIAVWPEKIAAGSKSDHVSAFWDFLPTVAELTGPPLDTKVDGVSMLPALLGKPGQKEHDYLYWEFHAMGGRVALRKGKWKAVRYNVNKYPNSPLELYDLSQDPGETKNVANQNPKVVTKLDALIKQAREKSPSPNYNFFSEK